MGGRGTTGANFGTVTLDLMGSPSRGEVSPIITAGLMELRGNEADTESTLQNIDRVRFNNLDHEQLFVVDNEGFVLKGYDGDKGSVAFDVESARTWAGLTVTHRHPGEFGGTFSIPDIKNAITFRYGNHEASANEGRYSMKPTKEADGTALLQALTKALPGIQRCMQEVGKELGTQRFKNKKEYMTANRKAQLEVVHNWYKINLPRYGYTYEFKERLTNE